MNVRIIKIVFFGLMLFFMHQTSLAIIVSNLQYKSEHFTYDESVVLKFVNKGKIVISPGKTVTIKGKIIAPLKKIFDGEGNVSFTGNKILHKVYPQWWGAIPDDEISDQAAIQNAIDALDSGMALHIGSGVFKIISLNVNNPFIVLDGKGTLYKKNYNGVFNDSLRFPALNIKGPNVFIKDLTFDGSDKTEQQNFINDIIRIEHNALQGTSGSRCTIENIAIKASNGGGITISKSKLNIIRKCHISNIYDNGVLITNTGADSNIVDSNVIDGTSKQNGIFITTDLGSENYVYGNVISNNLLKQCGDSPIESGYHSVGTIIRNNKIEVSNNSGILLRDCKNAMVNGNNIRIMPGANTKADGISVAAWDYPGEGYNWICNSIISNNTISGIIKRSGVHVNQCGISLLNNKIGDSVLSNGAGMIIIGSNHHIVNNRIYNFCYGINFDYRKSFTEKIIVSGNNISDVETGINLWHKEIADSRFENNSITRAKSCGNIDTKGFCVDGSNGHHSTVISGNTITSYNSPYYGQMLSYIIH